MNFRWFKTAMVLWVAFFITPVASADSPAGLSAGQTLYVPVYSNVFSGDRGLPFNLAVTLSIRNIDIHNAITLRSIEYHDNDGRLLTRYIEAPVVLKPLASTHVFIKESDEDGGFGANFIVRWAAKKQVNAPIVESVMIGARSGQGISFKSQGRVIHENAR